MSQRTRRGDTDGTDAAAHDVLAADEFALPVADLSIHPGPLVLPDDPTGIGEPHDVLAAEEFAMPAIRPHPGLPRRPGLPASRPRLVAAAVLLVLMLRRRRRRQRA